MRCPTILCIGILLFCTACDTVSGPPRNATITTHPAAAPTVAIPPLPELDPDLIVLGEGVYDEHCAECHGVNLEGEAGWEDLNEDGSYRAPAHDAYGHTWQHSDVRLIQIVKLGGSRVAPDVGISNMPPYATVLSEQEIIAVLTFIKSSWPEEIRELQWQVTVLEGTSNDE